MITAIIEIFATAADTLMLVWFVSKFVGVSLKGKLWSLLIPVLQLAVQLSFDWLMPGFSLLPMIIMLSLVFIFAVLLSPKTVCWDALSAALYISLMMLNSSFLFSMFSFFIDNMDEVIQGSNSQTRILHIVIAKLMLFFVYKLVLMVFKKDKVIELTNAIMTLILIFGTVIALSALMRITVVADPDIVTVPIFLIAFVMIVVNILLYLFICQIQKLQKSRYELTLLNERVALDERQSEDANVIWNNIRKVRHDLKNHFSVIKGCLKRGETDACYDYINSIEQTVESMGTLIKSSNSVIDYMINSKLSNLDGVQILISGCVGNFNDITDADMVCILETYLTMQ